MSRRTCLPPLLLLLGACNLCNPSPPTPPPADSCDNPDTAVVLANLEVGGDTSAPFTPWTADGAAAILTRGGQGLSMLGVRYRVQSSAPVVCITQTTVLRNAAGAQLTRRTEPLRLYTQPDATLVTRTLWLLPDDVGLQLGETATLDITLGSLTLTRSVVIEDTPAFPLPLGVWPLEVCAGNGVTLRVGLDRPVPHGGYVVPVQHRAPGSVAATITPVTFSAGAMTAPLVLDAPLPGGMEVLAMDVRLGSSSYVNVVEDTARSVAAPFATLQAPMGQTVLVPLELHCPPVVDETLQVTLDGVQHAVTAPAGQPVVVLRLTVPQGGAQLTVQRGGGSSTVNIQEQTPQPATSGGLRFTEWYSSEEGGAPLDTLCTGVRGETFLELGNTLAVALDVGGVRVEGETSDGIPLMVAELPSGLVLGPGEHLVVAPSSPGSGNAPWCAGLRDAYNRGRVVFGAFSNLGFFAPLRLTSGGQELDTWSLPYPTDDNRSLSSPGGPRSFSLPVTPGVADHGVASMELP
ncbi:MAG: hypothetical protein IPI55_17230 [Flavobacteriales bacterium]|nr:hypothetical protein [Flavobacteriales bacterium]